MGHEAAQAEPVPEQAAVRPSAPASAVDPLVGRMIDLQRAAGNAAVVRLAGGGARPLARACCASCASGHRCEDDDELEELGRRALARAVLDRTRVLARGSCSPDTPAGLCGSATRTCATGVDCTKPDKTGTATDGKWHLDVKIDIEVDDISNVSASTVGHTYVEFRGADGQEWTYGFYAPPGTPATDFRHAVPPCTVHPDRFHESCVDKTLTFDLTEQQYKDALGFAQAWCSGGTGITPQYDILDCNCTTFAKRVVEKAGQKLPNVRGKVAGFTADNPYTLFDAVTGLATRHLTSDSAIRDWLRDHSYDEVFALQQSEKLRLINRLLDGYVSDDDLQAVEWVCLGVRDTAKMDAIETAIRPRVKELNAEQGARLDAILKNRTFK